MGESLPTVSVEAVRLARVRPFRGVPMLPGARYWLPRVRARVAAAAQREVEAAVADRVEAPRPGRHGGVPTVELVPHGGPRRPGLLVHLHGGAFVLGTATDTTSALLCAATGLRVVSITYPLAPEHPYPAAIEAVDAALEELLADPRSSVLTGVSAGGNLALAALRRRVEERRPVPAAVGLLSPLTDARLVGDSHRSNRRRDPVLASRRQLIGALRLYAGQVDPAHPDLSPVLAPHLPSGMPPTMLLTGTRDLLLSDNVRLHRRLHEQGVEAHLRVWEGMWHSFSGEASLPEAQGARDEIVQFLLTHLEEPA